MAITEIQYGADGHMIDPFADTGLETESAPKTKKPTNKEKQDIIGLQQLSKRIPDEAAAVAFIEEQIWGDDPTCGHCKSITCTAPSMANP